MSVFVIYSVTFALCPRKLELGWFLGKVFDLLSARLPGQSVLASVHEA